MQNTNIDQKEDKKKSACACIKDQMKKSLGIMVDVKGQEFETLISKKGQKGKAPGPLVAVKERLQRVNTEEVLSPGCLAILGNS